MALSIGTAGWSYDDWKGVFYPSPTPARFNDLSYYARFFNLVEVNSTFYGVRAPSLAEKWCRNVAERPDFLFSLKLWQGLTHERPADLPVREVDEIRAMCRVLAESERLGALLVQFPWSFRFNEANLGYVALLLDTFDAFPCAVEMRHSGWHNDRYLSFLRERSVAFGHIDPPALRDCLRPTALGTAPFGYLRVHGRNSANWFSDSADVASRYDYLYNPTEVEDLARLARALVDQTSRVMVTTNNHFRGQAAANALMLRAELEGEVDAVPASLVAAYPDLQALPARHAVQLDELVQPDMFG